MAESLFMKFLRTPIKHGAFETTYNPASDHLPRNRNQLSTLVNALSPVQPDAGASNPQFGAIPGLPTSIRPPSDGAPPQAPGAIPRAGRL